MTCFQFGKINQLNKKKKKTPVANPSISRIRSTRNLSFKSTLIAGWARLLFPRLKRQMSNPKPAARANARPRRESLCRNGTERAGRGARGQEGGGTAGLGGAGS